MKHILFITTSYLGDAIISTTALETIRARYPEAKITIACGHIAAPIFEAFPNLESLHVMHKHPYKLHHLKLWWAICGKRWDWIVDLRGSGISYCVSAKKRTVWKSTKNTSQLRVQQIAALLGESTPALTKVYLSPEHRIKAKSLLPKDRALLLLSPMASWDKKCWPPEYFLELAQRLTKPGGLLVNALVGFLGDAKQRPQLLALLHQLPEDQQLDISGNVDLLTVAACLEQAQLFVGNDSGLMHLAAAMGTPTLGLFGPSRAEVYAPFGPKAAFIRAPLSYDEMMLAASEKGENLMHLLSVEDVLAACGRVLP